MTNTLKITKEERRKIYTGIVKKHEKIREAVERKERCWNGDKVCYPTRKKAIKALGRAAKFATKEHRAVVRRVYLCPYCELWHMTKKDQNIPPHKRKA